mmetsp:Transcript_15178/g.18478  ORF Transcript_15178/g.18478 Transcript_15178/m.18478 type:complete len:252 (-) Transcript_15178:86-841(-)
MKSADILSLLIAPIAYCNAFSQSTTTTQLPPILDAPISLFKRTNLKKKLIKAAKEKDEPLIISLVDELSQLNPTAVPTQGLMDPSSTVSAPLNGAWKLLFTNAKDAEAPARTEKNDKEAFGDEVAQGVKVKTGQRINAAKGECVNFIQLSGDDEKRPFDQLEITILMTPLTEKRVRLDFQNGRALNERAPLPFLKDFRFSFPPPSFNDFVARVRGLDPKVEPQAYFDVLYIDDEIRAHRTGEGKIFVQMRD